jgi:hypothetical protein
MALSVSHPRLLPTPGEGFHVLHYQCLLPTDSSSIIPHDLYIYPNFAQAQLAAQDELDRTLTDYLQQGYTGRYYYEINLELQGLITLYIGTEVDGYQLWREIPLSEFRIEAVDVWDYTWEAEARLAQEEFLFGIKISRVNNMSGVITGVRRTEPIVVVRVPAPEDRNPPSAEERLVVFQKVLKHPKPVWVAESEETVRPHTPRPHFAEEMEVEWAATRPSWGDVRKKDDTPFRDWEAPYAQRMPFSPPAPWSEQPVEPPAFGGIVDEEQ